MKKRLLFIISFLILLLGHSCKKDNDIFNSVGEKKVEYIVSDSAGNSTSAYMNVSVINN